MIIDHAQHKKMIFLKCWDIGDNRNGRVIAQTQSTAMIPKIQTEKLGGMSRIALSKKLNPKFLQSMLSRRNCNKKHLLFLRLISADQRTLDW